MPRFRTKHARWPPRSAGISLMTGVARLRPGHVISKLKRWTDLMQHPVFFFEKEQ
jgi:hypothetical protein